MVGVLILASAASPGLGQTNVTSPTRATGPVPVANSAPVENATQGGGFDDLLRSINLKAKVSPPQDFVVKSRPAPDELHFMPVGTQHPDRPIKVMTPAEVAAAESDLDAARATQQRRAGLKPVPVPPKPKKTAAKPADASSR